MLVRARRWCEAAESVWLALFVSFCGCIPTGRDWGALGDEPVVLGMRAEVVADGPYAEGLRAVPVDRRRTELLPGDIVEVGALVASAEGEIDLDGLDTLWFLAASDCVTASTWIHDAPTCPDVDSDRREHQRGCVVGRGARPEFEVPLPLYVYASGFGIFVRASLCVVAARTSRFSAEACAAALASEGEIESGIGAAHCLFGTRSVSFGPLPRLVEASPGQFAHIAPELLPPAYVFDLIAPDAGPRIESIDVVVVDASGRSSAVQHIPAGSTIELPRGGRLDLDFVPDPRDEQLRVGLTSDGYLVGRVDVVASRIIAGDPEVVFDNGEVRSLSPGASTTSFPLWVMVEDRGNAQDWARWTVEVVP